MSSLDEEDRPVHSEVDLNRLQTMPEKKENSGCSKKCRVLAFTISCIAVILVTADVIIPTALILKQKRTSTTSTTTFAAIGSNSTSTTIMLSSVNLNTTPRMTMSNITSITVISLTISSDIPNTIFDTSTPTASVSMTTETSQRITLTTDTISSISTTVTTTMIPPNLLVNPGAETGTLSPWIIGGSSIPTVDDGSENSGKNPYSGTKQFFGGSIRSGNSGTLTQSILLLNGTQEYSAAQLDSGDLHAYISFYEQSFGQVLGTDRGGIILAFRTLNNTLISTEATSLFSCSSNWCEQTFSYSLPIGTRRIDYIMKFEWQTGSYIDSYFDDNSLKVY